MDNIITYTTLFYLKVVCKAAVSSYLHDLALQHAGVLKIFKQQCQENLREQRM